MMANFLGVVGGGIGGGWFPLKGLSGLFFRLILTG